MKPKLHFYTRCWNCGARGDIITNSQDDVEHIFRCDKCYNSTVSIKRIELQTDEGVQEIYRCKQELRY